MTTNTLTASNKVKNRSFSARDLALSGMFAAILAVISQISIPMPSGIPLTIQVFGTALVGTMLGWKLGTFSVLTYILIGTVGLPVFSNFRGGLGVLLGLTGGYIWSWPVMSLLCGIVPNLKNRTLNLSLRLILALTGLLAVEIIGGLQWAFLAENMSVSAIAVYSLAAFLPKDIMLTIAAVFLGLRMKKMMKFH